MSSASAKKSPPKLKVRSSMSPSEKVSFIKRIYTTKYADYMKKYVLSERKKLPECGKLFDVSNGGKYQYPGKRETLWSTGLEENKDEPVKLYVGEMKNLDGIFNGEIEGVLPPPDTETPYDELKKLLISDGVMDEAQGRAVMMALHKAMMDDDDEYVEFLRKVMGMDVYKMRQNYAEASPDEKNASKFGQSLKDPTMGKVGLFHLTHLMGEQRRIPLEMAMKYVGLFGCADEAGNATYRYVTDDNDATFSDAADADKWLKNPQNHFQATYLASAIHKFHTNGDELWKTATNQTEQDAEPIKNPLAQYVAANFALRNLPTPKNMRFHVYEPVFEEGKAKRYRRRVFDLKAVEQCLVLSTNTSLELRVPGPHAATDEEKNAKKNARFGIYGMLRQRTSAKDGDNKTLAENSKNAAKLKEMVTQPTVGNPVFSGKEIPSEQYDYAMKRSKRGLSVGGGEFLLDLLGFGFSHQAFQDLEVLPGSYKPQNTEEYFLNARVEVPSLYDGFAVNSDAVKVGHRDVQRASEVNTIETIASRKLTWAEEMIRSASNMHKFLENLRKLRINPKNKKELAMHLVTTERMARDKATFTDLMHRLHDAQELMSDELTAKIKDKVTQTKAWVKVLGDTQMPVGMPAVYADLQMLIAALGAETDQSFQQFWKVFKEGTTSDLQKLNQQNEIVNRLEKWAKDEARAARAAVRGEKDRTA